MFGNIETTVAAASRQPPTVVYFPYRELKEVPIDDAGRYHLCKTVGVSLIG